MHKARWIRQRYSLHKVSMSNVRYESDSARQVVLLRLIPEDRALWRSLKLQAIAEAPQAFCSKLSDWHGPNDTEARWRSRLTAVPLNLLARIDEESVGMVGATEGKDESTVELISLWVAPSGRGHGVGDLLVNAVVAWAVQQNAAQVALDVREGNEYARALYLRHGFVDIGPPAAVTSMSHNPEHRFLHRLR